MAGHQTPAPAFTYWCGDHPDQQTIVWINPNCQDPSAGSPADQIRSILGGDVMGGLDGWVEQALSSWRGFCYMGMTETQIVDFSDGANTIFFRQAEGNGALAITYCNGDSVDAGFDMLLFDGDVTWSSDADASAIDIKGVVTHEGGHALGLGHSQYYAATMWPYLKGDGTANRILGSDDQQGVRSLYGLGSPGSDDCTFGIQTGLYDTCDEANELLSGEIYTGDTIWAANDYDPGPACTGAPLPGPDSVFHVWLDAGQELSATLQPETGSFDAALYLVGDCGSSQPLCLAGADVAGAGGTESLEFLSSTAGSYFLIVDSPEASGRGCCGIFAIQAQITTAEALTLRAEIVCDPAQGTLPLALRLGVGIYNLTTGPRRVAATLDLQMASGKWIDGLRGGQLNLTAAGSYTRELPITLPAIAALVGTSTFRLSAEDVTPGSPNPPAGDLASDSCTVSAALPGN